MPLEPTFTPSVGAAGGIKVKPLGQIIAQKLQSTWDQTKTSNTILATEVWFEWSNQDLTDKSVPDNRNYVIRVFSGRRVASDLEIGNATLTYRATPVIHLYCLDPGATRDGESSDIAADIAQYLINFFADNVSGFQDQGIHSVVMAEDNWLPNNEDPNWHHWILQLIVTYEMRRT